MQSAAMAQVKKHRLGSEPLALELTLLLHPLYGATRRYI